MHYNYPKGGETSYEYKQNIVKLFPLAPNPIPQKCLHQYSYFVQNGVYMITHFWEECGSRVSTLATPHLDCSCSA